MNLGIIGLKLMGQFFVFYMSVMVIMLGEYLDCWDNEIIMKIGAYLSALCLLIGGTLFIWFFQW